MSKTIVGQTFEPLELRIEAIPRSPLIEAIEREVGHAIREDCRHYLSNEPVHCGNILELHRDGESVRGRYEWSGKKEDAPTFHMRAETLVLRESDRLRWPQS